MQVGFSDVQAIVAALHHLYHVMVVWCSIAVLSTQLSMQRNKKTFEPETIQSNKADSYVWKEIQVRLKDTRSCH